MKKLLILFISIVLIIAVIGSCYALYVYRSDDIVVDLSTESSISLQITDDNGAELILDTENFNPNNSIIKNVKLTHNKIDSVTASGKGTFKVSLSGYDKLIDYIDVTATLQGGTLYNHNSLKQGVSFDLSNETNLTLEISFKDITLDEYVAIANKTVYITLTWELSENVSSTIDPITPEIESGYYILGTFNGWTIDPSYKMDKSNKSNCIAQKELFDVQGGNEFKVVSYDSETKGVNDLPVKTDYFMGAEQGANGTIKITLSQPINIYVNSNNEYYITVVE